MVAERRKQEVCSRAQARARPAHRWNSLPVPLDFTPPANNWFPVACAAGTVLVPLFLIARVRLHPALALFVAALGLGVVSGMPLKQVPLSFTAGAGNLMGHIAIVPGLAAVLR